MCKDTNYSPSDKIYFSTGVEKGGGTIKKAVERLDLAVVAVISLGTIDSFSIVLLYFLSTKTVVIG